MVTRVQKWMNEARVLNGIIEYYKNRSRLWKQAAKKLRSEVKTINVLWEVEQSERSIPKPPRTGGVSCWRRLSGYMIQG